MPPISGIVNSRGPIVEAWVVNSIDASSVKCKVDTGFSGDILVGGTELAMLLAARVLSSSRGYGTIELADGTRRGVWLYKGQVAWVNGNEDIDIAVALDVYGRPVPSVQGLLGTGLLGAYCLLIEYPKSVFKIYQ
jgi:hypothetical protein